MFHLNKRVKDLTLDELMGIASTEGKSISNLSQDKSNTADFIREVGIKDGDTLVPNYVIFHAYYKLWRPHGTKISKIGFLRKFSVVFESARRKSERYYLLNEGAFQLDKEIIDEAKRFDKRYRRKKAKRKIKSEVSSIGTQVQPED